MLAHPKCKPLVIGKIAQPRAFKGMKILPVFYKANKQAWITQNITTDWFNHNFVLEAYAHSPRVGLPEDCKTVLLLDNYSAHPPVQQLDAENVYPTNLPHKGTSTNQPMDQGIIRSIKCN